MSLRLRLALWYGALSGVLVSLVCGYSYAVHSRVHYDEIDGVLAGVAQHVAGEFGATRTTEERVAVAQASVLLEMGVRVYSADGAIQLESKAAASAPPVDLKTVLSGVSPPAAPWSARFAPTLHDTPHRRGAFGLIRDGQRWRVYLVPLTGGADYLVALAPLERIDASVRRFGRLMMVIAAAGSALVFIAGWLVAARALRPVALLTEEATTIARSREFSGRVSASSVAATHDELGRLAETFNEMLTSLEVAYSAQRRFVADASHELRAPLTAIQANLELLQDRAEMSTEERALATREAASEASRLARLVSDLLVLARADAGVPLRRAPVELDRVLMEVVGEARHLARGQRLEIDALDPSEIFGDADRVKQLLLILVDNAIRYTPAGGRIAVSLRRSNGSVDFVVRDTGIGIAMDEMSRVFERFYRADPARARDPGGTGLGLSIARWIAHQHGGDVVLESVIGHGTVATVHLPRA